MIRFSGEARASAGGCDWAYSYPFRMEVRTVLPCDASSVAAARRLVRGELAAHAEMPAERSDFVDAASLLVSELVTNAIVHARTDVEVRLVTDEHMLRAEVSDGNPTFPIPRRPIGLAGTGRGLLMMDDLASRWGVSPSGAGKTVWFELTFAS
jgi:anti-sigma regulatory factor (Ser/Thr protein kinase)